MLTSTVLGTAGQRIAAYLPVGAGAAFATSTPDPYSLSPWVGAGVLIAWGAVLTAVAAVQLRRRDA